MLKPFLQDISPNDYPSWEDFVASEHADPYEAYTWFVLAVGLEGFEGTTLFQVLVSTPAAVTRATGNDRHRRVLIVESFEPHLVEEALRDFVASTESSTWEKIVEQLQATMYWEYEKQWC